MSEASSYGTQNQVTVMTGPTASKSFKIPTNEDELISWCEAKREQGRAIQPVNQMKLNMAFYLGFQWVTWDHRMRAYRRPTVDIQDPNTPVRISANKIGSLIRSHIAKLTKNVPEPECRPVSNSDDDVSAARVGTRILAHEMDRLSWNTELQRFLQWPEVIGWGFMHPWWDPNAGDVVGEDEDVKEGEDSRIFAGEVCLDIVAPFELGVDPSSIKPDLSDATWAIRTTTMTRESAWEKYGKVLTSGGSARSLSQEVHALGAVGQAEPSHMSSGEWVNVHQLWMKPCRSAPKGCVITWAGTEIIDKKLEFPYDHGMLPFIQCSQLPGLGTREGRTTTTDLIPLQTDYNDTLSREATIRRQLTPKLVAAIGQVDPQRITSRVDVLQYMPGVSATPPHLEMPNAAWAQQFETGMNRDEADMADITGLNEASQGRSAATAAAATTMSLQEADETKLSISATELSRFIEGVGTHILLLCKQYWEEERTVRVWSDDDVVEAYRYLGSDIDEKLDVHISSESALPRSKSARAQLFMELQARFPGIIDPQMLLQLLDMPGTDILTKSLDIDTRKQHREIAQLLLGENPQVRPYDNHVIHLKVLNDFRKSIDYENLPIEMQAHIDAHAAIHESLVLKQMGLQVPTPNATQDPTAWAQAQMASAGPGGAPGPSPDGTPPAAGGASPGPPGAATPSQAQAAQIGGPGNPGRVPGISLDTEAHLLGR
jgi:hypothetical protein